MDIQQSILSTCLFSSTMHYKVSNRCDPLSAVRTYVLLEDRSRGARYMKEALDLEQSWSAAAGAEMNAEI